MTGTQVLLGIMNTNDIVVTTYLSDLTDAELLMRPTPEANHLAWQLGHLLSSEPQMVKEVLPDTAYPVFPAGFEAQHGKEAAAKNEGFLTKAEYLDLYTKVRAATRAAIEKLSDADLDKPNTGSMKDWFPTVGSLLIVAGDHPMMHAGQMAVLRRKLGKPILM